MAIPKPATKPLEDLFQMITRGEFQKEVEFRGKKFLFRSLCDEDYNWRDQYVNMSGPVAFSSSQRSPTLAIACVAIDGVAVEEMHELNAEGSGVPQAARDFIRANERFLVAHNLHEKVFSKMPREYVVGLFALFIEQVEKEARIIEVEDIKNS